MSHFRPVPTADVNTTFALALSVWLLMIFFSIRVKGVGGFMHELFCSPFGSNPLLWPLNLAFNVVEYISKPLSHSLRLFGNMYAGEIIYLLLWMLASAGVVYGGFAVRLRHRLVDLPRADRPAAGLHLHDAHHRVHRHGAREPLAPGIRRIAFPTSSHHRKENHNGQASTDRP